MFIDKNSIKINNIDMGQYLTEVKYQYNKLWASDSGRNLAGEQSGTLIGVFPKFILSFRKLNKTEFQNLAPIFDSAVQEFRYYDPNLRKYLTIQTYTGDYEVINKTVLGNDRKNEPFDLSFISVRKR